MIAGPPSIVFDFLDPLTDVPVFRWFPDDMTELPCVVIGWPATEFAGTQGTAELPVYVIGRTLNDETQQELLLLVDELSSLLFKGVPDFPGKLRRQNPGVQAIGGTDFPAYVLTVEYHGNYC